MPAPSQLWLHVACFSISVWICLIWSHIQVARHECMNEFMLYWYDIYGTINSMSTDRRRDKKCLLFGMVKCIANGCLPHVQGEASQTLGAPLRCSDAMWMFLTIAIVCPITSVLMLVVIDPPRDDFSEVRLRIRHFMFIAVLLAWLLVWMIVNWWMMVNC